MNSISSLPIPVVSKLFDLATPIQTHLTCWETTDRLGTTDLYVRFIPDLNEASHLNTGKRSSIRMEMHFAAEL